MKLLKIGQAFVTLSASEFHHIMFAEAAPAPDAPSANLRGAAPDTGAAAQLAAMKAQLEAAKAEAQANQAKADAHLAQMEAQKQQNEAAAARAQAEADQARAEAQTAKNNAALMANMGMQGKADEIGERIMKATGGVWDAGQTFHNLQGATNFDASQVVGEIPTDFAKAGSALMNQAPAMMSGQASPIQVLKTVDLSESLGKEGQDTMRNALKYANQDGLRALNNQIDNFNIKNIDMNNGFVKNILGDEDAKEIGDAFNKEKEIFQKRGLKGVMNQLREEIADPQQLPLDMYAHQMHDTLGSFGINFDETRIHDAIDGFKKLDLDNVAEQLKDKAMKSDYKKVLHKTVGKVENFTKDGIPGMWDKMWHKKHKTAGHMLSHVGGGNAKAGLKHVLDQHRREVHMSKLEQFYNDSWQHIMMNLVALFILLLCLAYLYNKYRKMLKNKKKQML